MNEELNSNNAETQQLNIAGVSGSPSFKEKLINNFIPRIERMEEIERQHLHYLIDIEAPLEFIQKSQETQLHFVQRIKEYKEYAKRL